MASQDTLSTTPTSSNHLEVTIEGMTCGHCVARVESALRTVPGVDAVEIDLDSGHAQVQGGSAEAVITAIEAAGYHASVAEAAGQSCDIPPAPPSTPPAVAAGEGYRIDIGNMTCASCVARVENAIRAVPGVQEASVNLVEGAAYVVGGDAAQVADAVSDQGYPARPAPRAPATAIDLRFDQPLDEARRQQAGAILASVHADLAINWDDPQQARFLPKQHPADYLLALREAGFTAHILEATEDPYHQQTQQARTLLHRAARRAALAGVAGFALMFATMGGMLPSIEAASPLTDLQGRGLWLLITMLALGVMTYSGYSYYTGAWKQARHGQANMDTLVAVGTGAAWLASLLLVLAPDFVPLEQRHLYLEASMVILAFLQVGHVLEILAKARTGRAIGALVELAPRNAVLLRGQEQLELPVTLLQPGDEFLVRPGTAVATDGVVSSGSSSVNEAMLTGEALPVAKQPGDSVTGGTMNASGTLTIRVTRVGENTTLAHIIQAVKRAQMSKPPIGRLVDQVAAVFVPVVMVIAVLTFFGWLQLGPSPSLPFALTASIAVLVIACPCALGLATPIAIMVGMGRAAQLGVLIRNGDALQAAAGISHLVVDKTGTLTEGRPRVTHLHCLAGIDETQALQWAASLEYASEHPLAQALVQSAEQRQLELLPVQDFLAEAGHGVTATLDGRSLLIGRLEWLQAQDIAIDPGLLAQERVIASAAATPVWLADQHNALAVLGLSDPLREDSLAAVAELQARGIEVVMCTGDHAETALAIARELHIHVVHSRVLPAQKADIVMQLQQQGHNVGMVGDGINDAPALAQADIGFAIGSGTDVAIETADVTLASNSLSSAATAVALSKATLRNIRENLFGAFIYNTLGIPLAAGLLYPVTGWLLNPMYASAAMALSSVTVVSNANRLRLFKPVE